MSTCGACHPPAVGKPQPPELQVVQDSVTSEFSHAKHAARSATGKECTTCHAAIRDTDDNELRQATILEVQRTKTVIDLTGRRVTAPVFELGDWVIPQGYSIIVGISRMHANADAFPDPDRFDPQRFVGSKPPSFAWIPFGGGSRRCVGAVFANMEMDVVLRTVLRHFTIETTTAPGEKWHSRGVAYTPKDGGKIVVHRR